MELQLSSLLPPLQNTPLQNIYLAAMSKTGDAVVPAHPLHVALLQLTCILIREEETGVFVLEAAVYLIR